MIAGKTGILKRMQTVVSATLSELPRIAAIAAGALMLATAANAVHPMQLPLLTGEAQPGLPRWVARRFQSVDAQKAKRLVDSPKVLVVDTRDARDFRQDHLPRAVSLPYHGFGEQYPEFAATVPKDRPLLLYCYGSDCGLAARVGKRLIAAGYTDVAILRHGIEAWKAANLPLETLGEHNEQ
jgi:rhodanese-related sulfurtransferase